MRLGLTHHNHGWVVAVTQDHGLDVALPPVVEPDVIVVGVLALGPAIESFVHDQNALAIARIEERRRDGVVAGADRIVAVGLEQLDAALLRTRDGL